MDGVQGQAADTAYRVGVGNDSNPCAAALRAVEGCTDWDPAQVAGKRVIIKPNLVAGAVPESGVTTDPEIVRVIVDKCLEADAAHIRIVEAFVLGDPIFDATGYEFFATYDPLGRISLVNLAHAPVVPAPAPGGLTYPRIYLPQMLFEPGADFISAAKLKVHELTQVTLSMKNLFGLPTPAVYAVPEYPTGRHSMHRRSVHQSIVDISLPGPPDFAIVDGIWGLDVNGPLPGMGMPKRVDLVMAGRNPLAVDLVCVQAMGLEPGIAGHLAYRAALGIGPSTVAEVDVLGDPFDSVQFTPPERGPAVGYPWAWPTWVNPGSGTGTWRTHTIDLPGAVDVGITRVASTSAAVQTIRRLQSWVPRDPGRHWLH